MAIKKEYNFTIPYFQYMDACSDVDASTPTKYLNKDFLLSAYTAILESRFLDEKAINLQRTGLLGTYPGAIGQEAIGVGIANGTDKHDILAGYYRDQTMQLQRGILAEEILRYWGGHESANQYSNPNRKNDMPICVPIGTQCLHAVGIAYAQQYKQTGNIVITTIGDGGTSQGDFYEALNAAAHWKLPLIFIINNNQWAISIARTEQTAAETLAQKAIAAGMHGVVVDGNDVIAMTEAVSQAATKARNGDGPTLIEAQTFRLCDHTTADDASRYVPDTELAEAQQKEPTIRLKKYLQQHFKWTDEDDIALQTSIKQRIQKAAEQYLQTQPEALGATWKHLYHTLPTHLHEQQQEWIDREIADRTGGNNHD